MGRHQVHGGHVEVRVRGRTLRCGGLSERPAGRAGVGRGGARQVAGTPEGGRLLARHQGAPVRPDGTEHLDCVLSITRCIVQGDHETFSAAGPDGARGEHDQVATHRVPLVPEELERLGVRAEVDVTLGGRLGARFAQAAEGGQLDCSHPRCAQLLHPPRGRARRAKGAAERSAQPVVLRRRLGQYGRAETDGGSLSGGDGGAQRGRGRRQLVQGGGGFGRGELGQREQRGSQHQPGAIGRLVAVQQRVLALALGAEAGARRGALQRERGAGATAEGVLHHLADRRQ
mmetsp:Transcript_7713/g.25286  ORF Transcript_7713/g.25286 Transcript_7713/m.25286 type:complete len:287 (-) Transcript_7713:964-1824(-)